MVPHFLRPALERIAALARQLAPDGLLDRAAISADELGVATAALLNGLAIERAFDRQRRWPAAQPGRYRPLHPPRRPRSGGDRLL